MFVHIFFVVYAYLLSLCSAGARRGSSFTGDGENATDALAERAAIESLLPWILLAAPTD